MTDKPVLPTAEAAKKLLDEAIISVQLNCDERCVASDDCNCKKITELLSSLQLPEVSTDRTPIPAAGPWIEISNGAELALLDQPVVVYSRYPGWFGTIQEPRDCLVESAGSTTPLLELAHHLGGRPTHYAILIPPEAANDD